MDLCLARKARGRQQEASVELAAVDREQIDLVLGVSADARGQWACTGT